MKCILIGQAGLLFEKDDIKIMIFILNHLDHYQVHTLRHYTGALTDIRPAKTEFYF